MATDDDEWEYWERSYDFSEEYGSYPSVEGSSVTKEIWDTWETRVIDFMRDEMDTGWQVDQTDWGPQCIKFEKRRINLLSQSCGAWVIYIILSLITYGIGFLIIPFFMDRDFMQFISIDVTLKRSRY